MEYLDSFIGDDTINLLCRLMMVLVVVLNWKHLKCEDSNGGTGFGVLWLTLTLYSVFYSPQDCDNYTSMANYVLYINGASEVGLHFEHIYFRLMDIAHYGYVSYRFLVWGIGIAILVLLLKRLRLNPHISTVFIIGLSSALLFYQRAVIGYAMIYWALYFIIESIENKGFNNRKNIVLAVLLLAFALPFHKTMIIYELIIILSLVFPKNKYALLVVLSLAIAIPILLPGLSDFVLSYTSEDTQETALNYAIEGAISNNANVFGTIALFVKKGPFYVIIGYCLWNLQSDEYQFSNLERILLINTFFLLAVSFFYSSQYSAVHGKFFTASLLPFGMFLSSFYTRYDDTKLKSTFNYLLLFSIFGSLAISLMSNAVNWL